MAKIGNIQLPYQGLDKPKPIILIQSMSKGGCVREDDLQCMVLQKAIVVQSPLYPLHHARMEHDMVGD